MLRKPNFEQYLNEATDSYRLETDWDIILKICDLIRQGDIKPTNALNAIQKKISNPNSVVALYGLTVLESCVKNCGALIQDEISTKQFMESFKDIIKSCPNENVKTKCLDLLQSWAFAFRNNPKHRAVQDTVTIMKTEGYKFPTLKESDAMFLADTAPSWKDGDRCHRCRTMFTMLNRRHHCRACGEVFCQQCSSHNMTLPKFGIEKQVRVCDTCFDKFLRVTGVKSEEGELNSTNASTQRSPSTKTEEEWKEEEELQLAIALSQSEAESRHRSQTYKPVTRSKSFSPPVAQQKTVADNYENDEAELSHYLNRTYWETRASSGGEKIREAIGSTGAGFMNSVKDDKSLTMDSKLINNYDYEKTADENGTESNDDMDVFQKTLRNQVEILVNRMKSNSSRGRSIANDTSVQNLFLNITAMHSQLLRYIQQLDDKRVYYEGLQDKLTQVKDARAALNTLRDEHKERVRREAEMAERQRKLLMAQTLEIMRQKKQEYLQYQRQLALKRIHDQERELHMRQEQQIQQYRLNNTYGSLPYVPPTQPGGVSAFEPVAASMGMNVNMNNLPAGPTTTGPFASSAPYAAPHYTPGQNVSASMQPQPVMMGQSQIVASNVYVPGGTNPLMGAGPAPGQPPQHPPVGNQPSAGPTPWGMTHNQMMTPGQPPNAQYVGGASPQQQPMHAAGPPHMHPQQQRTAPSEQAHMGPPQQPIPVAASLMHAAVGRSVMAPPSSSPLSSPSSSSEHSIIQHEPQPMPSAPSATSTPQPEVKDDMAEVKEDKIAELISFD